MQSQIQRYSLLLYQDTEEYSENIIPRTTAQYIYTWCNLCGLEYIRNCSQRSRHMLAAYASLEVFMFSHVILTTILKSFQVKIV